MTRRPSIRPLSASTNAPAQIEQIRLPSTCLRASHRAAAGIDRIFSGMTMLGTASGRSASL